jgi:hypothetical protein
MAGIETQVDSQGFENTIAEKTEVINEAIKSGLLAVALKTQAYAQKLVPVEYGKLRASAFVKMDLNAASVTVGFTADYASFVNDKDVEKLRGQPRPSGLGTYWSPGGSHFMEKAQEQVRPEVVPILQSFIDRALE